MMMDDVDVNGFLDTNKHKKMSAKEERRKWWKIYAMHFLFSWNSRTFEYVSVRNPHTFHTALTNSPHQIFLVALAFPKGLFATSIR